MGLPLFIHKAPEQLPTTISPCRKTASPQAMPKGTLLIESSMDVPCKRRFPMVLLSATAMTPTPNLPTCHMPGNLTWRAEHDLMNCRVSPQLEADNQTSEHWTCTYENGKLIQSEDPLNRIHTYKYDAHSRLIEECIGKHARVYTYDLRGLLKSAEEKGDDISVIARAYDSSGRLIEEKITLNGKLIQQTQQSWTPTSRSLKIGGHKQDFHYQAGQLKNLSSNGINLAYSYAADGSLTGKTTPFSQVDIHYNKSGLPETVHAQLLKNSYKEALEWTPSGKLSKHEKTYPDNDFLSYTYTERGHLKTANDQPYTFDFGLPGRGIRTAASDWEVPGSSLDPFGKILTEVIGNKTTSTTHNPTGQVIIRGQERLSWDPWGRLVEVSNNDYVWKASYDALGRRLQTQYTPFKKGYIWNSKGKPTIITSLYDPEKEFLEIGVAR